MTEMINFSRTEDDVYNYFDNFVVTDTTTGGPNHTINHGGLLHLARLVGNARKDTSCGVDSDNESIHLVGFSKGLFVGINCLSPSPTMSDWGTLSEPRHPSFFF